MGVDMQKMLVQIPRELHHRLRIQAVIEKKTMSEVIAESLTESFNRKGEKEQK